MPAKYLQALGEDRRPELHRQIGCVTGILQAFDRRYPIVAHQSHKRLLPPGNVLSSSPSAGEERTRYGHQIVLDKNLSKSWIENQRAPSMVELSQTSCSSSSCSSFSSLDGNRSTQQDLSSTDRMLFPEKPFKSSPRLKSSPDSDYGPDYYPDGTLIDPSDMLSAQSTHRTLGIRNLVKDSIYRDTRDLSVRISTEKEVDDHRYNYGEPATRFDEPPSSCIQGKSKGTMDINESLRVLAKLRESSWNPSESGQQQRLFFKSPIVIMKPAKSADLGDEDSPVVPLGDLSDIPQLRSVSSTDKKKISQINRAAIEQHPKSSPRVPSSQPLISPDGRANGRNEVVNRRQKSSAQLMTQSSSRKQQSPSFLKNKNSTSTRLPQKKLDMERRARPPIPSIESNKNQRQSADRSHLDTVSPRSKVRRKLAQGEDGHQNGAKNRTRSPNLPGDDMSTRSDGSMSVVSDLDTEVTSADRSAEVNASSFQRGNQTPTGRNPQKVKTSYDANKDLSSLDPAASIPERPSPVSVLDSSFDQDNSFCTSKTSKLSNVDDERHPSDESLKHSGTKLTAESGNSKFANVASLLQKLQQLTLHKDDDEAPPVDHIAFLCEVQIPDHRYVSEILLASGLLMKDLGSGLSQIQLHSSGYPINPDLFLVLEQRKSGWTSKPDSVHQNRRSDDPKRAHRKLMFDAVNNLLLQKFEKEISAHSTSSLTRAREVSSGQQLVKAICTEIEHLKTERSRMCHEDSSRVIPDADILNRLEGWTTSFSQQQLPGMVLEIERSIFKELVDEVVRGESADGRQAKAGRRGRRRLFA
uniref:Uncharacterized protein n=1 Tax=Avena sativa TaxID=4498 RepID=A0ACD5UA28_AVESA